MGRTSDGTLLLADEITPDSCRLWDQRDHSGKVEHLDKDLFRRDLGDIIPAYEEIESRLAELAKSEASKSQSNAFASPHLKRKSDAGFLVISQSFILLSIQIQ